MHHASSYRVSPFHSQCYPPFDHSTVLVYSVPNGCLDAAVWVLPSRPEPPPDLSVYSTASGCTVSPLQVMLKGSNISHSWEDIDIEAISDVVLPRRGERPCNLVLANELELNTPWRLLGWIGKV